ncbi:MAG: hypothetical protein EBS24_04180, partial [Chitinophagia bacterium]|nr:hypothetical protein [Chitinophagia bacterium]
MIIDIIAGILVAIGIIVLLGFLDDVIELSGSVQLGLQFIAAFCVVLSGISVTHVTILGQVIDFN